MSSPPFRPRALFFDVFGTCVDWRTTVTDALAAAASEALSTTPSSISEDVRAIATAMTHADWADLAQAWRNSYLAFTRSLALDPSQPYKTVDEHHLDSLIELLTAKNLLTPGDQTGSLFTTPQLHSLNLTWHRLTPWPDTIPGLHALNAQGILTCTLTNGNLSLIKDMATHSSLPFSHLFSAEMFSSYKPNPKVYLGAVEKVGLKVEECAMVAAHLEDLQAARKVGLRAVYVERPGEERFPELKGKVETEVWVSLQEGGGFEEVARRLGVS